MEFYCMSHPSLILNLKLSLTLTLTLTLYISEAKPSHNQLNLFLEGMIVPQLSVEDTQLLDSPITLDE